MFFGSVYNTAKAVITFILAYHMYRLKYQKDISTESQRRNKIRFVFKSYVEAKLLEYDFLVRKDIRARVF